MRRIHVRDKVYTLSLYHIHTLSLSLSHTHTHTHTWRVCFVWARTIARGLPGVEGPPGLAAIAHLCAVLRARGTAFGRTAGASTCHFILPRLNRVVFIPTVFIPPVVFISTVFIIIFSPITIPIPVIFSITILSRCETKYESDSAKYSVES